MIDDIKTADEAIDALGGTAAVAEIYGVDVRVVSNWRKRGLPPDTYLTFHQALIEKGRSAPPKLWRQRSAKK